MSLVLLLTACYDKDIQEINNRLDNIENTQIASLQEQVKAINSSIAKLEQVDSELKSYIETLKETSKGLQTQLDATNAKISELRTELGNEINNTKSEVLAQLEIAKGELEGQIDTINTTIGTLQQKDSELLQKITDLNSYVTELNNDTKSWVSATFATLEQYNAILTDIAAIKEQIVAINKSINDLETNLTNKLNNDLAAAVESMKQWVNGQLTEYYKIAEIDAKIEAIEKSIKSGDETITASLDELKESLQATKTALTEAYTKAIEDAITNNNGVIDSKIAAEITAVNKRIDSEVNTINSRIAALEERIKAIEDKLNEILNRKLEIAFDVDSNIIVAPNYTFEIGYSVTSSTNSATVEVTSSADIKAKVVTNGLNGKISITTGNAIDEYSKVVVFVSNGENVIMRSITFEQATVQINNSDTKIIPVEGGKVELSFLTNVECEVVIPSSASSWLTVAPTTMAPEQRTITLQATANEGLNRSAVVTVKSVEGNLAVEYTIKQESNIVILNYTTNDSKPLDLYSAEGFGAELAENSYDAATGKGYLKFNGKIDTIPANAFVACTNLTWIEIPDCITTIGDSAFRGCSAIEEITIPSSVKSIGTSSFEGCGGKAIINCEIPSVDSHTAKLGKFYKGQFTEVVIGNGVTSIGMWAFLQCASLTNITIPDGLTSIGQNAFYECTSLTSITIPDSVINIGGSAFYGCSSLTSITIPDSVTDIGRQAFFNCSSLKAVYYNGNVSVWCKINFNGYSANPMYYGAKLYINGLELTEVTIPSDITEIKYTFTGCTSLKSVILHSRITSIGDYAFYGCATMANITIPHSVTSIGDYAFYKCYSMASITIPDGVTAIGQYTFNNCSSLSNATIGNGVISIEDCAFQGCNSLTNITIPDSVTNIGSCAFNGCKSLTSVTIGNRVSMIGHGAFRYCPLTRITIPESVTSIGESTFEYCSSLKEVYCKPITPPNGGNYIFINNAADRKIYVPRASVETYKSAKYWSNYADCIVGYDF